MKRPVPRGPSNRETARHEAAHAVVAVRLGLPLASTDILPGREIVLGGVGAASLGYTTLVEGTAKGWGAALPDPTARASIEAFAAQAAAGIVMELARGARLDDPAHRDDIQGIVQIAGMLGIGNSTADACVREFIGRSTERAAATLRQDDGAAWSFVAEMLRKRKALTGDEVRALVAASDEKRAETPTTGRKP